MSCRLSKRAAGVLRRPAFKLADRDESLATTADKAKVRRDVSVEEIGTNTDCRRSLSRGKGDAGYRDCEFLHRLCCPSRAPIASERREMDGASFFAIAPCCPSRAPIAAHTSEKAGQRPRLFSGGARRAAEDREATSQSARDKPPELASQRATNKGKKHRAKKSGSQGRKAALRTTPKASHSNSQQQSPSRTITAVNSRGRSCLPTDISGDGRSIAAENRCIQPSRWTGGLDAHHRKARHRPRALLPRQGR